MIDSPAIRKNRLGPVKPRALSTAYSWVLSRTDMIMVLHSTKRIIPMITNDMIFIAVMIALAADRKLCWKTLSVSVLVSAREFANRLSMASDTDAESSGLAMRTMYQPMSPRPMT